MPISMLDWASYVLAGQTPPKVPLGWKEPEISYANVGTPEERIRVHIESKDGKIEYDTGFCASPTARKPVKGYTRPLTSSRVVKLEDITPQMRSKRLRNRPILL